MGGTGIVIADMRLGPAEKVAQEVRQAGVCAEAIECDITSEVQVEKLASQALGRFGDVNLLFNVAGVSLMRKLHETSSKDVEWLFSVNVFGLCHMIRHFVPSLKAAAGRGECAHIVNFSSGFGLAVPPKGRLLPTAYAGTKHAVVGLSDALRKELEPDGIGVSVVCPGLVNTEAWNSTSFRQARFGGPIPGTEESRKRVETWGQDPAETASLVLAAVARGEFFILPLSDTGRSSMRSELNERFEALGKAIDPEV
jgi:NAD(P)-dependent dehydrogenase (short-subunit alcohol dehydrogenase family)